MNIDYLDKPYIHWVGGGGGGGPSLEDQFGFARKAALLEQGLNRYDIDSPYGTTRFKGQKMIEKMKPGQRAIFKQRQAADIALAKVGREQAERQGEYLTQNRDALAALRQQELGAAQTRSGARGRMMEQMYGPGGSLSSQFDPSAAFAAQGVGDLRDVDRYGQREQDLGRSAVEGALLSRLDPSIGRDRERMEARLAAQGVAPGSEAYREQMDELGRSATDRRFQAVLAGGQEQSRLEGLRQAELGRRTGLRQQLLEEELTKRRLPLDELAALEG